MPITLVTGLPGHGKTLYTLDRFRAEAEKAGRPVFHNDIPGLSIPGWQVFDPKEWEKLPAGALGIIDEAWEEFPVTGRGQTPDWVQQLAKHRHLGLDFVVIVQQPMLLDSFVRRLVDRHFHVVRKFGTRFATIYENPVGVVEDCQKPGSRKDMIRHEYRYNAEAFTWYKSAELHTVKRRLPARIYLLIVAPIVFGLAVWLAWLQLRPSSAKNKLEGQTAALVPGAASSPSPGEFVPVSSPGAAGAHASMSPAEYAVAYTPRLAGLPHTAPIYDGVTQPQQAPYPAACLASAKRCQCYSQQGTRLDMAGDLCRKLSDGGFFVAWAPDGARVDRQAQDRPAAREEPRQVQAPALAPPEVVSAVAPPVDPEARGLPHRVRRVAQ